MVRRTPQLIRENPTQRAPIPQEFERCPHKCPHLWQAAHKTAGDLHGHGFVAERNMQRYEALCLEPVPEYNAAKIHALRKKLHLSQTVLAAALNTSSSTVQKWGGRL